MFFISHKIELKPNKKQVQYFTRACGVARFAYNWGLNEWKKQYENGEKPSESKLRKQLNSIKKEEFPWMLEVTKSAPQYSLAGLGEAYKRFFKQQSKYPKFKKKGTHDSFRADDGPKGKHLSAVQTNKKKVKLPKIGWVRMKEEIRFSGRILSCVISRTADKWFASFCIEINHTVPVRKNQATVGVDLGIKNLAILSDGTVFNNPKALRKNLKKLRQLSKSLSRKKKGSNNRRKYRMKLARLYYRIACIRKDALHKLSYYLVKNYTKIGVEDLNVSGMVKNRKLSRAISDVGFYELRRQLEYKAALHNSEIVVVDRWFPSSKTCSECGCIKDSLKLSERFWTCTDCGTDHDRDINAANNLKFLAESSSVTACGDPSSELSNELKLGSVKQEALV